MRLDRDQDRASDLVAASMAHLPAALEIASALLARHPERAASIRDLDRCLEYARQIHATGLPRHQRPEPRRAEGSPDDEEIRRRDDAIAFDRDVAARLELCLCVFGTLVWQVTRDGLAAGDPLADAMAKERARHLEHRRGERRERITTLESAIAASRRRLETGASDAESRVLAATEAALAKVQALDDVTLCTDRCAF